MSPIAMLRQKFRGIWPLLNERTRRLTAANEAIQLGYGGVSLVHRVCGLSRKAIAKGIGSPFDASRAHARRSAYERGGRPARLGLLLEGMPGAVGADRQAPIGVFAGGLHLRGTRGRYQAQQLDLLRRA